MHDWRTDTAIVRTIGVKRVSKSDPPYCRALLIGSVFVLSFSGAQHQIIILIGRGRFPINMLVEAENEVC